MTPTLAPPPAGASAPSSAEAIERARRLFALQREARWREGATRASERRAKLRAVLVQGRLSLAKLLSPPYDSPRIRRLVDLLVRWQARP